MTVFDLNMSLSDEVNVIPKPKLFSLPFAVNNSLEEKSSFIKSFFNIFLFIFEGLTLKVYLLKEILHPILKIKN